MKTRYDYIICGAGCAGLSLAYYLSLAGLRDKQVLVIDKDAKTTNDRTWCYWEKGTSPFDPIVEVQWTKLQFHSPGFDKKLFIDPYKYKKIRGIDFYKFVFDHLESHPNITFKQETVQDISEEEEWAEVRTGSGHYQCDSVFVSYPGKLDFSKEHYVLQHFKGWEIKTASPSFKPEVATFMDFRTDQKGETRFLYVLPTADNKALVELAIFSNKILEQADYDQILEEYIGERLEIKDYTIEEKEFGIIPMSTFPFEKQNTSRIKYIGTAGGWVKASSGFAFDRIQKKSKQLASAMVKEQDVDRVLRSVNNRYRLYDRIFLNVILTGKKSGSDVFTALFKSLPPDLVFKFLDEETSFLEDVKLFTGPPTLPFIKGFFAEMLK